MILPYKNGACRVSSPYGNRILNGEQNWHAGIDLVGLDGDRTLVAPCDGIIRTSTIIPQSSGNLTWEWGNYIRLDTPDGYSIFMCHMAERRVSAGQAVKAGDVVGIQGNSGYSFGEHCHFEVRRNGTTVNPAPLLGIKNEVGVYKNPGTGEDLSGFIKAGTSVWYVGTKQYGYSSSDKIVNANPCKAKITAVYPKGRHPYHVVGNDVYGWVNKSDVVLSEPIVVRVTANILNVRSGPGLTYAPVDKITDKGTYVLSSVSGSWGKLKNGRGWIALAYTEKIALT